MIRNHFIISGTYVCQAKNSLGESEPVSTEIDVKCMYSKSIRTDIFKHNIKFHKSFC